MAKDSYWFKHDSSAGRGLKIRKIQHIYGHWGKGIYWDVIEVLREQNNYIHESDESSLQLLASLIGCNDFQKFSSWFKDCVKFELFELVENRFYSPVLCENMSVWDVKKANGKAGGRGNTKAKRKLIESETKAKRKHKIREEKIREDNIINTKEVCTQKLKVEEEVLHPLQALIKTFPKISLLKQQLDWAEAEKLTKLYSEELIKEKIEAMENKKDLLKKYESVYLTLNNWCRLQIKEDLQNNSAPKPQPSNFNPNNLLSGN